MTTKSDGKNHLWTEHERLLEMLENSCGSQLNQAALDRQTAFLEQMAKMQNCGVTIFDIRQRRHVFASYNFGELFDYDMEHIARDDRGYFDSRIHRDDIDSVLLARIKYFRATLESGGDITRYKLIFEYRIEMGGKYVRVIEQMQAFECDGYKGLALSLLDISPNQTSFTRVEAKIFDMETRQVTAMPDYDEYRIFAQSRPDLTEREKEVLRLVRDGFLSKEISEQLRLSLNTVNTYRQRILEKLAANNSREAVRYAEKFGLLE